MLDFFSNSNISNKTNDFIFVIGRTWFFSFDMKKYTIFDYLLGHVSCLSADVNWIRLLSQEEQDGRRGESRIKKKNNCFIWYITKSFFIQIMQKQRKSRKNRLIKTINWWNTQQRWEKISIIFLSRLNYSRGKLHCVFPVLGYPWELHYYAALLENILCV